MTSTTSYGISGLGSRTAQRRHTFCTLQKLMRPCTRRRYWPSARNLPPLTRNIRWLPHHGATAVVCAILRRSFISSLPTSRRTPRRLATTWPSEPEAWLALLNRCLPRHLRDGNEHSERLERPADYILEIVLTAQRLSDNGNGVDLLYHLGEKQGRWRAVTWLVKHMLETTAVRPSPSVATLDFWASQESLSDITQHPPSRDLMPQVNQHTTQSLDQLTGGHELGNVGEDLSYRHNVLGSLWRSLGLMTLACADGEMKSQVLELIAYLHHMEVMPSSIYSHKHCAHATAVQQPPMLRLFQSTILASLSDAAWRAHERAVADEAGAQTGKRLSPPPSLPGAAVRMTLPGLRPEVWMELILWSCLYGGWILEGAATLRAIHSDARRPRWRPLSWTSFFRDSDNPDEWERLLAPLANSRHVKRREPRQGDSPLSVQKTVSSELVNAYVDALLITVRSGAGKTGAAPSIVLEHLATLRRFLQRAGLGLRNGSWDAIVLRFFESQESIIDQTKNFETLMDLSPGLGDDINVTNHDNMPQYVLDGSAATLGLFHRALRSRIARGDAQSAIRLFGCLQTLADHNKHRSLVDFFERSKLLAASHAETDADMFTSNFPGIEYPAFNVQIPPTILGPFVELLTDAKAYEWVRWLLYNEDDFDGPILSESDYNHPAIAPALVKFAAETRDTELLAKASRSRRSTVKGLQPVELSGDVLNSFVESQIDLKNWRAAERVIQHDRGLQPHSVNTLIIAHMIRSMLLQSRADADASNSSTELDEPMKLLANIVCGKYDGVQATSGEQDRATLLLILLATVNREWAEFCLKMRPLAGAYSFTATVKEFNLILEGVVGAFGSSAGRRLLETFSRLDTNDERRPWNLYSQYDTRPWPRDRFRPEVTNRPGRLKFQVAIPGHPAIPVTIYGRLQPNVMTWHIILRKAIEERRLGGQQSVDRRRQPDTVAWAVSALNTLQDNEALQSAGMGMEKNLTESDLDEILFRSSVATKGREEAVLS